MKLVRSMKRILKEILLRAAYGYKGTEKSYLNHLRRLGMEIGENVHLYTPHSISIDEQRPWMISVGNNVHITAGVSILQHDYSWSIIQHMTGEVLGSCGKVCIGTNVFIGQKAILLKGTKVEDNVIIGAGSVVSGTLTGNAVWAGVPAKRIMGLDEFIEKKKRLQRHEAALCLQEYERAYGVRPPKEVMREFFWLFEERDKESLNDVFRNVLALDGNADRSWKAFLYSNPTFSGYDQFCEWAEAQGGNDWLTQRNAGE